MIVDYISQYEDRLDSELVLSKPHRADRRWETAWSPEQISRRLVLDFPDDAGMRISHEAIYQALYQPRACHWGRLGRSAPSVVSLPWPG